MPIYQGSTPIVGVYRGSTPITRVYSGSDLVFDASPAVPDRLMASWPDGTDYRRIVAPAGQPAEGFEYYYSSDRVLRTPKYVAQPWATAGMTVSPYLWDEVTGAIIPGTQNGDWARVPDSGVLPLSGTQCPVFAPAGVPTAHTWAFRISQGSATNSRIISENPTTGLRSGLRYSHTGAGGLSLIVLRTTGANANVVTTTLANTTEDIWIFSRFAAGGTVTHFVYSLGGVQRWTVGPNALGGGAFMANNPQNIGCNTAKNQIYNGANGIQFAIFDHELTEGEMEAVANGSDRSAGGSAIYDVRGGRFPIYHPASESLGIQWSTGVIAEVGTGYPVLALAADVPSDGKATLDQAPTGIVHTITLAIFGQSHVTGTHNQANPGPYCGGFQLLNGCEQAVPPDFAVDGYSTPLGYTEPTTDYPQSCAIEGSIVREYAGRDDVLVRCAKGGNGGTSLADLNATWRTRWLDMLDTAPWDTTALIVILDHGGKDITNGTSEAAYRAELDAWWAAVIARHPSAVCYVLKKYRADLPDVDEAKIQAAQTSFCADNAECTLVDLAPDPVDVIHPPRTGWGIDRVGRAMIAAMLANGHIPAVTP